jgi:hypothetical protein
MSPANITGLVPQHIVDRMDPKDRAALGQKSSTEARADAIAKDEREIQKQIAGYLRLLNVWHVQSRMDRKTSNTVGAPDFIFPYKGAAVFWEVKCPWLRSLRPEQAHARERIEAQGGEWRLITSLAEAQAHLRELDDRQRETEALQLDVRAFRRRIKTLEHEVEHYQSLWTVEIAKRGNTPT